MEVIRVEVSVKKEPENLLNAWWNAMIDAELKTVSDGRAMLTRPVKVCGSKSSADIERDIALMDKYKAMLENSKK